MSESNRPTTVTIGPATLMCGDALALLAAGRLGCDAIISDPPYGISYQHGGGDDHH